MTRPATTRHVKVIEETGVVTRAVEAGASLLLDRPSIERVAAEKRVSVIGLRHG